MNHTKMINQYYICKCTFVWHFTDRYVNAKNQKISAAGCQPKQCFTKRFSAYISSPLHYNSFRETFIRLVWSQHEVFTFSPHTAFINTSLYAGIGACMVFVWMHHLCGPRFCKSTVVLEMCSDSKGILFYSSVLYSTLLLLYYIIRFFLKCFFSLSDTY